MKHFEHKMNFFFSKPVILYANKIVEKDGSISKSPYKRNTCTLLQKAANNLKNKYI